MGDYYSDGACLLHICALLASPRGCLNRQTALINHRGGTCWCACMQFQIQIHANSCRQVSKHHLSKAGLCELQVASAVAVLDN